MGQTPGHNIVVEILIPARRLSVLPFHTYEDCMNCLILVGALFSMNINFYKINDFYDGYYVAYKPITLSCILFM